MQTLTLKQINSNVTASKLQAFAATQHAAAYSAQNAVYYTAQQLQNVQATAHNVLQHIAQHTSLQVTAHYVNVRKNFAAIKLQFAANSNAVFVAMLLASIAQKSKMFKHYAKVQAVQTASNVLILRLYC